MLIIRRICAHNSSNGTNVTTINTTYHININNMNNQPPAVAASTAAKDSPDTVAAPSTKPPAVTADKRTNSSESADKYSGDCNLSAEQRFLNRDPGLIDFGLAAVRSGLVGDKDDQLCQIINVTSAKASPNANTTSTTKRKVVAGLTLRQATPASTKPKDGLVRKFFYITLLPDGSWQIECKNCVEADGVTKSYVRKWKTVNVTKLVSIKSVVT